MIATDRGNEFWRPPPLWPGATAFLLGGGPSLTTAVVDRLRGQHVIVINSSWRLAPWAEILFFTDNSWLEPRREAVSAWRGLAVSSSGHAKRGMPDRILRIEGETRRDFPPAGSATVRQGRSSGHTAIGLAVALGATRIVLLGYDMREIAGRSHHHDDYRNDEAGLYKNDFLPSFRGWNAAAIAAGVEVLNATPSSALAEFPVAELADILEPGPIA